MPGDLTITLPAPAPAAAPSVGAGAKTDAAPNATPDAGQATPQATNNDTSANASGNPHFSQLLSQNHTAAPTQATTGNAAKSTVKPSDNGETNNAIAVGVYFFTQLQQLASSPDGSGQPVSASSVGGQSAPSGNAALIQQMEQILQQLTADATAAGTTVPQLIASLTTNANSAGIASATAAGAASSSPGVSQLIGQLSALLGQSDATTQASQPLPTITDATANNASLSAQAQPLLPQNVPTAVTLITQLATALEASLKSSQTAAATNTTATSANTPPASLAAVIAAPASTQNNNAQTDSDGDTATPASQPAATSSASPAKSAAPAPANSAFATAVDSLQNAATPDATRQALTQIAQVLTAVTHADKPADPTPADAAKPVDNTASSTTAQTAPGQPAIQPTAPAAASAAPQASGAAHPLPSDQVLVQIRNAVSTGANEIKIQLAPEDLGKVVVQMTTDSTGKTNINITADNRQTLDMLQREARSLESSLRDIGLKTGSGSLSFNLSGQQHNGGNQPKPGGYTQVAGVSATSDDDYGITTSTAIYRISTAQAGLDIRV